MLSVQWVLWREPMLWQITHKVLHLCSVYGEREDLFSNKVCLKAQAASLRLS